MANNNRENMRRRHGSKPKPQQGGTKRDQELDELLASVSLLDIVRRDTGQQGKTVGDRVDFRESPWGTHDSLSVYTATNSFKEFSENHEAGGTVIDYFVKRDNCTNAEAVAKLREEAGMPRKQEGKPPKKLQKPQAGGLPPIKPLQLRNLPDCAPVLIEDTLRQGHKAIIQGASKAGKTWLLIQLALAVATGTKWIGQQCREGRVLYVNFEVDDISFLHRCQKVAKELCLNFDKCTKNIDVWGLRGEAESMETLAPLLIERAKAGGYALVILDPLYKCLGADENSAQEVGLFCNQIDRICKQLGSSVVYCHHHSKGSKADAAAIDRGSGSGVFGRDPDAILDLIQLYPPNEADALEGFATAWRVSPTLREFKPMEPFAVTFAHPIHIRDHVGAYDNWEAYRPQREGGKSAGKLKQAKADADAWETVAQVASYFAANGIGEEGADIRDIETICKTDRRTLKKRLCVGGYFDTSAPGHNKCFVIPTTKTLALACKVAKHS